jgi:hypothetical protein
MDEWCRAQQARFDTLHASGVCQLARDVSALQARVEAAEKAAMDASIEARRATAWTTHMLNQRAQADGKVAVPVIGTDGVETRPMPFADVMKALIESVGLKVRHETNDQFVIETKDR